MVGKHIRKWRHENGLSIAKTAVLIGLSKSQVFKMESGNANEDGLELGTLRKIQSILQISLDELTK